VKPAIRQKHLLPVEATRNFRKKFFSPTHYIDNFSENLSKKAIYVSITAI
jgi:hypothetical protein